MVRRHLKQQVKDSHVKARNRDEDRPAIGALSKGKAKGKGQDNAKHNTERGDSVRWITKDQCSFGEACAFKHDPNKKGKEREERSDFTFSDRFTAPEFERRRKM